MYEWLSCPTCSRQPAMANRTSCSRLYASRGLDNGAYFPSTQEPYWLVDWLIDWLTDWLIDWLIVRMTYTSPCVVKLDVSNVSGDIHFDFHILPCEKNNKATSSVRTTVHGSTNMVVTTHRQHHHYKELSPSAELTAELLSSSHTLPIFVTLATRFLLIRTFRAARSLWMHCEDQT